MNTWGRCLAGVRVFTDQAVLESERRAVCGGGPPNAIRSRFNIGYLRDRMSMTPSVMTSLSGPLVGTLTAWGGLQPDASSISAGAIGCAVGGGPPGSGGCLVGVAHPPETAKFRAHRASLIQTSLVPSAPCTVHRAVNRGRR